MAAMRSVKLNFEIKPNQILFLWELLFVHHGDPVKINELDIQLRDKKQRDQLEKNRLIEVYKERRALVVVLSETGWLWCEQNLDLELSSRSPKVVKILQAQLKILHQYMKTQKLGLYDFFMFSVSENSSTRKQDTDLHPVLNDSQKYPSNVIPIKKSDRQRLSDEYIFQLIREAYFRLTKGREKCRVRLYDIKKCLNQISSKEIDRIILKAHRHTASGLKMYPLDVPSHITDKDREAAIMIAGTPFHIIYVEK